MPDAFRYIPIMLKIAWAKQRSHVCTIAEYAFINSSNRVMHLRMCIKTSVQCALKRNITMKYFQRARVFLLLFVTLYGTPQGQGTYIRSTCIAWLTTRIITSC